MPPDMHPGPNDLDLEDFRRLGVRPNESRLTVLRSAVARSSKPLVDRQLSKPSPQTDLQLSRVATSAYRCLDPRQRSDSSQRAHIGRILPNALAWAGRTPFLSGTVNAQSKNVELFDPASDQDLQELVEVEASPVKPDEPWTKSLSHDDLLRPGGWRAILFYLERRVQRTPVRVSLACFLILAIFYLAFGRPDSTPISDQSDRPVQEDSERVDHGVVEQEPARPIDSEDQTDLANTNESDATPPLPLVVNSEEKHATDEPAKNEQEPTELAKDEFDPEESIGDGSIQVRLKHPIPDVVEIENGLIRWEASSPWISEPITNDVVEARLLELREFRDRYAEGSVDHWIASRLILQLSWLINDVDDVESQIDALKAIYLIDANTLLVQSHLESSKYVATNEARSKWLRSGILLIENMIVRDKIEVCGELIDSFVSVDPSLLDPALSSHLDEFQELMPQLLRIAETSRRIDTNNPETPRDDLGIVGRYYCLMRRDWATGLNWLTHTSDVRIANLAKQEMEVAPQATSDQWLAIANRWLELADRIDGRAGESMRIHAAELFQKALPGASGIKRLNMERKLDSIRQSLPFYVQWPVVKQMGGESKLATPVFEPTSPQGLSGRVLIDGMDIGFQVSYRLGVRMTHEMLQELLSQAKLQSDSAVLEFEGVVVLEDTTQIQLFQEAANVHPIFINERELELESAQTVMLEPGVHHLKWRIEMGNESFLAFLVLRDDEGDVTVYHQQKEASGNNTTLTFDIVPAEILPSKR